MRSITILWLALAACLPPPPTPPLPAAAPTVVTPPPTRLSDTTVVAMSHAFFEAFDRFDRASALASLGSAFVMFEDARFTDATVLGHQLQTRIDRHVAPRTRTWSDEHVFATATSAIFIGDALEHIPAESDHPAADSEGYNTLTWIREGDGWKLAAWEWVRGGIDAKRDRWDEAFRVGTGFNHEPNQLLVDTLKGKTLGRALDLLMGQGRNAIYEASQGWKVTGIDISREGIRIATAEAAKRKLVLDVIDADVDKWDLGVERWDLVTMIYAGNSVELVAKVKPSLRHGGLFVLEYFHADSEAAKSGAGGWATGQLATLFSKDGYTILRDDVVDERADYSLRTQKLVRFVAQKR